MCSLLCVCCVWHTLAARCAGGKTFTAKYRSGYKDWLEDVIQKIVTSVTARSAPQPTVPEGATFAHDCEKLSQKRRICRECALWGSGSGASVTATVYSCRPCNQAVHIESFCKHICQHLLLQWHFVFTLLLLLACSCSATFLTNVFLFVICLLIKNNVIISS